MLLRLQIDRCLPALAVERHRVVLMGDHPPAADSAGADRGAPPHFEYLSIGLRSTHLVETVAEGDVIASDDVQIADLVADRADERYEPGLSTFPGIVQSRVLEGDDESEREHIRRYVGHQRVDVFGTDRI